MLNKYLIHLLIVLSISFCAHAQNESSLSNTSRDTSRITVKPLYEENFNSGNHLKWYSMFTNVPRDIGNFSTSAFNSDRAPLIAALAVSTGAFMMIDEQGWQANRRLFRESKIFHNLSDFGVALGNEKYHFIMVGMFGAWGLVSQDSKSLKTASNIVEAIIASGVSAQVLKRIFGRESPAAATEAAGEWTLFPNLKDYQNHQPKYYSYPSGHITTLTATVTILANNYPDARWIKPVGYTFIAVCGVSLVSRGMHWYSDLPAGFFLGYTFGNIICPQQEEVTPAEVASTKIHVQPYLGLNDLGLEFSLNF